MWLSPGRQSVLHRLGTGLETCSSRRCEAAAGEPPVQCAWVYASWISAATQDPLQLRRRKLSSSVPGGHRADADLATVAMQMLAASTTACWMLVYAPPS